jgi:integrase
MGREVGRLTARQVANAKPKKGRNAGLLADGGNLYLQLTLGADSTISRSWVFNFELDGKRRFMGLGATHTVSLAEARDESRKLRQQVRQGVDPLAAKHEARRRRLLEVAKSQTFEECAEAFIEAKSGAWTNRKHAAQWEATLATYAYPVIGSLSVAAIDTGLVLKVLEQKVEAALGHPAGTLWTARRETATRVRGRLEAVLDWAGVRGLRTGDNPARWRGHLEHVLNDKKAAVANHHAALPYAELPGLMAELRTHEGIPPRALEFVILTATRAGEVLGALWSECDLDKAIWIVPAERMKARREHACRLRRPPSNCCGNCRERRTTSTSSSARAPGAAFPTWRSVPCSTNAWAATASPCTDSARASWIGRTRRQHSQRS